MGDGGASEWGERDSCHLEGERPGSRRAALGRAQTANKTSAWRACLAGAVACGRGVAAARGGTGLPKEHALAGQLRLLRILAGQHHHTPRKGARALGWPLLRPAGRSRERDTPAARWWHSCLLIYYTTSMPAGRARGRGGGVRARAEWARDRGCRGESSPKAPKTEVPFFGSFRKQGLVSLSLPEIPPPRPALSWALGTLRRPCAPTLAPNFRGAKRDACTRPDRPDLSLDPSA